VTTRCQHASLAQLRFAFRSLTLNIRPFALDAFTARLTTAHIAPYVGMISLPTYTSIPLTRPLSRWVCSRTSFGPPGQASYAHCFASPQSVSYVVRGTPRSNRGRGPRCPPWYTHLRLSVELSWDAYLVALFRTQVRLATCLVRPLGLLTNVFNASGKIPTDASTMSWIFWTMFWHDHAPKARRRTDRIWHNAWD